MKKKEILQEYKKKIKLLKKYNLYYYDKSNPLISDQIYDNLKKEIISLENKIIF